MRERALVAERVDRRRAHAEHLGYLLHREQLAARKSGTPGLGLTLRILVTNLVTKFLITDGIFAIRWNATSRKS